MGGGLTKRFVPPHLLNHVQKSSLEILKDDKIRPEMVLLFFLHLTEAVGKILRSGHQRLVIGAADPEHESAVVLSGGMEDGMVPRLRRDH